MPPARALAASALLLCARSASAQAWVASSSGTVETATLGEDRWTPLTRLPAPVKDGTHVRTGAGATAAIALGGRDRLRLGGGSELALDEVGARAAAVKLQTGALEAFAEKGARPPLRVRTPTAQVVARGAEFSVEISPLRDTQVVVDDGVVAVRLPNGETAELGEGREFRSLLVVAGRPLRLLPHPREEAGAKTAAKDAAPREWPDCLHGKNGVLRPELGDVAACQRRLRAKLAKSGELTLDGSADLRAHQQEELRQYARVRGWLPDDAPPEQDDETAAARTAGAGGSGDELAKALAELRATPQTGGSADLQLPPEAQSLLQQLQGGGGGGQVSPAAMNSLIQALLGGPSAATGAAPAPAPKAPDDQ